MNDPVARFLQAVESATIPNCGVFSDDVALDATVPNWRFSLSGRAAVEDELAGWFADAGRFESVRRAPLPEGELVEFTLTWEENGEPHMCHQLHALTLRDGRIARDLAFCGGRWDSALMAEMGAAPAVPA